MTRLEYIRQLPGMKNITAHEATCPYRFNLDAEECDGTGYSMCIACYEQDATINGQPAPYIFTCPVKPGQTVYHPNAEDGAIYECEVEYIIFVDGGWTANCTNTLGFDADAWGELIFPTREAAEKKLEEIRGDEGRRQC